MMPELRLSNTVSAGEIAVSRDLQIDEHSDAELLGGRGAQPIVRFTEAGYYRAKVQLQEFTGHVSLRLQWRRSQEESYRRIDPALLYAAHPGLPLAVEVVTGGVPALPACEAGVVEADARLSSLSTAAMGVRRFRCA